MYLTATLTSTIIITFIVLIIYAPGKGAADVGDFQYNIIQAAQITSVSIIPYLIYPYVLIVFIAAQIIREK